MKTVYDHIVVGSGCTGAMAAQTLVEAGSHVAMIDVGNRDLVYKDIIPDQDFTSIRQGDPDQHRYFLGDAFEGIPWNDIRVGAQLTPPRQFIHRDVERWIPLISDTLKPLESLAYGGLGNGWGLNCFVFASREIEAIGLGDADLMDAYETVLKRISISAAVDDGAPYCIRELRGFLPPLKMDDNIDALYRRYLRKKGALNARGFFVGQPPIALISRDLDERKAYAYKDMDYWSDQDRSAYRPWITVDRLRKKDHFSYHGQCLAIRFEEHEDRVEVVVRRTDTNEEASFFCRRLVLACGVLGTARILIRSFDFRKTRLPLICNPYTYVPLIHLSRLGKPIQRFKTSLCQLIVYQDENRDNFNVGVANLYTYRSLLLFKLLKECPLNFVDARYLMQFLQSSFVIAGIFHPETYGENKYIELVKDSQSRTGDKLRATYLLSEEEKLANLKREKQFCRALRTLGCFPTKRIYPGHGSSIHYAGTLPFSDADRPFTLAKSGRMHGTRNVYVADGSGFTYLPAKGLTFTLMANAHRVAKHALA